MRVHLAVLLVVAFIGCGSDDGDRTPGPDTTIDASDTGADTTLEASDSSTDADVAQDRVPIDALGVAMHELMCEIMWECSSRDTLEDRMLFYGRFESLEACREARPLIPLGYLARVPEWQAFVEDGSVGYDPRKASECLDALHRGYCNVTEPSEPPVCREMLTGTVAQGDPCSIDEQCMAGLRCDTTSDCDGVCEPINPSLCGGVACADDEYCDADVCTAKSGDGEPCADSNECLDGYACDASEGSSVCVSHFSRDGGDPCSSTIVCAPGYLCVNDVCATLNFSAEGESCSIMTPPPRLCQAGLTCQGIQSDGRGTCQPPLSAGSPCSVFWECDGELYCDEPSPGDPKQCVGRKAEGSACIEGAECVSYYCSNATDRCAPPPYCTP
jgi:hypothetical protein